jgi:hypothetical protein
MKHILRAVQFVCNSCDIPDDLNKLIFEPSALKFGYGGVILVIFCAKCTVFMLL